MRAAPAVPCAMARKKCAHEHTRRVIDGRTADDRIDKTIECTGTVTRIGAEGVIRRFKPVRRLHSRRSFGIGRRIAQGTSALDAAKERL